MGNWWKATDIKPYLPNECGLQIRSRFQWSSFLARSLVTYLSLRILPFSILPTRGNLYRLLSLRSTLCGISSWTNQTSKQIEEITYTHKKKMKGKKNKKKPYIKTIRNEFEWKQIAFNVDCIDCVMQVWHEHTYIPTKQPKWKEVDEEDNET